MKTSGISKVAALAAMGAKKADTMTKDVVTIVTGESFPASAISNTHEVPTGRERLMHAIKLGKENYHLVTNGKRLPKKPTKKQMQKVINHMLRKNA